MDIFDAPVTRQIEVIQLITAGKAFGELSYALTQQLDEVLAALHRDATDQAAAENDALHGSEVSQLTDMWVSPCGTRVGG